MEQNKITWLESSYMINVNESTMHPCQRAVQGLRGFPVYERQNLQAHPHHGLGNNGISKSSRL